MKDWSVVIFLALVLVSAGLSYIGAKIGIAQNERQYQRGFDDAINAVKFNEKRVYDDNIVILKDTVYLDSNIVISKKIIFVNE